MIATTMTQRRQRRRLERDGEALDDIGAMPRDRSLGDGDHGALAGAGVIFGDDDDKPGHDQPEQAADEEMQTRDCQTVHDADGAPPDRKLRRDGEADDR